VPVPRIYKTQAIVLSRFDFGEADRVLTLLTPHDGKLKAIAKGVRRPGSRIGGSVEPFAELHLLLVRGRTFDVITQASVGEAWLRLRDRLDSAATAWYLGELADRAVEERAAAYPIYALLRRACQLLDDGMAVGRVARWYELELADALGVRPEIDRCTECDQTLEEQTSFRWVPALGGIVCERSTWSCRWPRSRCSGPTAGWTSRRSPRCGCHLAWKQKRRAPCAGSCATLWSANRGRWHSLTRCARATDGSQRPRTPTLGVSGG
jgi:DNA repair protein RecO